MSEQKQTVGAKVDLDELVRVARETKAIVEAPGVTAAPWRSTWGQPPHPDFGETISVEAVGREGLDANVVGTAWCDGLGAVCRREDAALIAHGRTALPTLADGVLALAPELQHLRLMRRIFERKGEPTYGPFDQLDDGTIEVPFKDNAGVAEFIFGSMAGLLEGMGGGTRAPNYITIAGWHPVIGRIECTIQRVGKLSPHEARKDAEKELARAIALLAQHGIPWDGPTEFTPDLLDRDPPAADETPWLRINAREQPNRLECRRCGGHQDVPDEHTAGVLAALIEAFKASHGDCEDGDAEALSRSPAANGTGGV